MATLQLTEREIAIARGENPDDLNAEVVDSGKEAHDSEVGKDADTNDLPNNGGAAAAADSESSESWLTDEHRNLANSYGFSDADLKSFQSEDDFNRFASMFEQKLTDFAKQSKSKAAAEAAAKKPEQAKEEEDDLDLDYYKGKGWEEESLRLVQGARKERERRKEMEQRLEAMEKAFNEAAARQQQEVFHNTFHSVVDNLGEDLFGRVFDENGTASDLDKSKEANRHKLYEAAELIAAGIVAKAKEAGVDPNVPPLPTLLSRAKQMVFASEIRQVENQKRNEAVMRQSKQRRPVAASRPVKTAAPTTKVTVDNAKEVANHPELTKAWAKFQEENGSE